MKIKVFAALKDYFDKDFLLEEDLKTIADLKAHLAKQQPKASALLNLCRFAVHDEFVALSHLIHENDEISVIPPSSGG
ncbi:MoaD/ThiS family protein [Pedobacter puniceum]|uniref:MoaD/ThiS family protein n=1 Tax=Pedobacter puniceum TaxID=2666136 RepID=A0A7K0FML6_9SPHI|nr:MoaD/ThiS family protein [Pedobacter puniceum]MRX47206.1 MoaD/ThiS family protein [Pedobacter puniceum]